MVTASVDHVSFDKPIHLGNVITITSKVTRAFNTSLEGYVEVSVADISGHNSGKSNHASFTFVALNPETKRPQKVHQIKPKSKEDLRQYKGATRRRELRLLLSGRLKPQDAKNIKQLFTSN